MIKELFKDMGKYLPSCIVPAIVGFFSIPIITRLFPPEDFGNYALVYSTITILSTLVAWLVMGVIRFHPAYERDKKLDIFYSTVLKWFFISVFGVSIFFLIALLFGKDYISQGLYRLMLIGLIAFVSLSFFEVLLSFLQTKRLVKWYANFSVWKSVTAMGFGLILIIIFKFGIGGLFWGIFLSTILSIPWLWRKAIGKISLKRKTSTPLAIEMAKFSFPLVIGNLAYWILTLSDRYILEFFRTTWEVGIYSASYAIAEKSILLLVSIFALSSTPLAMNIWEKEGEKKSRLFNTKLTRYFLIICFPIAIGLSVLARPVLDILTGQEYSVGYRILPFVVLGIFMSGATIGFGHGLGYYKKTNFIMWSLIAGGLVNLGLNFIFVPKYGYMAAAITTLIGYMVITGLDIYFSRKFFTWNFPLKSLGKTGCASLIMGLLVYYLSNVLYVSSATNLVISVPVGMVIYMLMLFLFREFQTDEIKWARVLMLRIFKLG